MKADKRKCPICRKETVWERNPFRPFCSERCRIMDLGGWAAEKYRIPAEKSEQAENEQTEKKEGER